MAAKDDYMKFHSQAVTEHQEVPLADAGALEQIMQSWQGRQDSVTSIKNQQNQNDAVNYCYVVTVTDGDRLAAQGKQQELLGLLANLGEHVCGQQTYQLIQANAKTLMGRGALEKIADKARDAGANLLVFDAQITPSQARNIEHLTGLSIQDREGVILNVFLKHAKTRSAKVQVELAQLQYLKPRIRGLGMNMDQQAGGIGAGKGPGETASELLARQIDKRIVRLQQSANKLKFIGENQRSNRQGCQQIALVGYTNAGKTSLMNALCGLTGENGLSAKDAPFETLDTTTRVLKKMAGLDVLLSDTVGFIRQLPQNLIASFESTISQALSADLLLLVVDVSDPEYPMQLATTEAMLTKLGADDIRRCYVFNKIDKLIDLDCDKLTALAGGYPHIMVSSQDAEQVTQLQQMLLDLVTINHQQYQLYIPYIDGKALALVHHNTQIISQQSDDNGTEFNVKCDAKVFEQINELLNKTVASDKRKKEVK